MSIPRKAAIALTALPLAFPALHLFASTFVTQMVMEDRFTAGVGDEPYRGAEWCGECHAEHYRQWQTSLHAQATTVEFRPLHLMQTRACYSCHGFEDKQEGVSCEVCHGPGHTAKMDFGPVPVCARCHGDQNPVTGTKVMLTQDEWRESAARDSGQDCYSCHMPRLGTNPPMHFHGFFGGVRHPEIYPGQVRIGRLHRNGRSGLLSLENAVTGHFMPTGCSTKYLELEITGRDSLGDVAYSERRRFQRELGPMMGRLIRDTRLRDGERRWVSFRIPDTLVRLEVSLRLHPSSLWEGGRGRVIELDQREWDLSAASRGDS